jgi:hypothetical protein
MGARPLAKARRREAVAATKGAREVRRLAVADELRDVVHGDRRLLGQQLRRGGHAPREQILVKAHLAELRVRALHLTRRARHRRGDRSKRQAAAVVARHDDAREQVHALSAGERLRLHTSYSDPGPVAGRERSYRSCRGDGSRCRNLVHPRLPPVHAPCL